MPKDVVNKVIDDAQMLETLKHVASLFDTIEGSYGPAMYEIAKRFEEMSNKLKKVEEEDFPESVFDHAIWVNAVNRLDGISKK